MLSIVKDAFPILQADLLQGTGHGPTSLTFNYFPKVLCCCRCLCRFLKQGYLLLENTDEGSNGQTESPNKLSLFLNLEKLGEIRIDMLWDMEELLIKFTCEKTQASLELSESGEDLRQALQFRPPREILFTTGKPHPEEELMERLTGDLRGLINTRI